MSNQITEVHWPIHISSIMTLSHWDNKLLSLPLSVDIHPITLVCPNIGRVTIPLVSYPALHGCHQHWHSFWLLRILTLGKSWANFLTWASWDILYQNYHLSTSGNEGRSAFCIDLLVLEPQQRKAELVRYCPLESSVVCNVCTWTQTHQII